ncbi:hypothetical protein GCM10023196_039830 [Actinoallomurus vinaceus]|uniref:DUF3592 domain-containing protein n=1 Tax=Actinoallomurus vinaceus TaxID=1080074 RepID=A0ABP8UA61_9ACTN
MSMPPEPPELRRLTGRRRPSLSAALFVLVIFVIPLSLLGFGSVAEATRTVDAYRATHDGVQGVFTVEWSTRRQKGGYATSGSFVSGDGAVRRSVTLDGNGRHSYDQTIPAEISGAAGTVAYPRNSHAWISDVIIALITGALALAGTVLLLSVGIGRLRHR